MPPYVESQVASEHRSTFVIFRIDLVVRTKQITVAWYRSMDLLDEAKASLERALKFVLESSSRGSVEKIEGEEEIGRLAEHFCTSCKKLDLYFKRLGVSSSSSPIAKTGEEEMLVLSSLKDEIREKDRLIAKYKEKLSLWEKEL